MRYQILINENDGLGWHVDGDYVRNHAVTKKTAELGCAHLSQLADNPSFGYCPIRNGELNLEEVVVVVNKYNLHLELAD